jgi:hypothetical protein
MQGPQIGGTRRRAGSAMNSTRIEFIRRDDSTRAGVALMVRRSRQVAAAVALLVPAIALSACASTTPVDQASARPSQFFAAQIPSWAGGEPAGTPTAAAAPTYPNVFDQPPTRQMQVLSDEQQRKAVADLNALHGNVDARIKSARAHDDENTAAAVTESTRGQVGRVDDPNSGVH